MYGAIPTNALSEIRINRHNAGEAVRANYTLAEIYLSIYAKNIKKGEESKDMLDLAHHHAMVGREAEKNIRQLDELMAHLDMISKVNDASRRALIPKRGTYTIN
jgi:hypothetical protein